LQLVARRPDDRRLCGAVSGSQVDRLIASVSNTLLTKASRVGVLPAGEKKILQHRLDRLSEKDKLDASERDESISASIVLREFSRSVAIIDRQSDLFEAPAPSDRVALSEYYCLSGEPNRGRSMADKAFADR